MPPSNGGSISFFGVKLENVPKAVLVLVAIGLTSAAGWLGWWTQIRQPEYEATLARQARDLLQRSVNEYGRHIAEEPESVAVLMDDARGRLVSKRYADLCTFVSLTKDGRTRSKLILALDFEEVPKSGAALAPSFLTAFEPVLLAQGRCLNPHPPDSPQYPFATWYGERRGCWVEVWRQWRDGCTHSQWFDSCHNVWASNPDGSPAVRWTSCVH